MLSKRRADSLAQTAAHLCTAKSNCFLVTDLHILFLYHFSSVRRSRNSSFLLPGTLNLKDIVTQTACRYINLRLSQYMKNVFFLIIILIGRMPVSPSLSSPLPADAVCWLEALSALSLVLFHVYFLVALRNFLNDGWWRTGEIRNPQHCTDVSRRHLIMYY